MSRLSAFVCAFLLLFYSAFSLAQDLPGWSPEHEVPEITFVGEASQAEYELAKELRKRLIKNMTYWQARGLQDPPDLESIIYMADTDNLRVREIFELINPNIDNVVEHIKAQYKAFEGSTLWVAFQKFSKYFGESPDQLRQAFFEFYVNFRYGFTVHNLLDALEKNIRFKDAQVPEFIPQRDNAYYVQLPRVDLTAVLYPCRACNPDKLEIGRLVNFERLNQDLVSEKSLRIVILPRTTQEKGDIELTTLGDFTVTTHEQGHHIVASLGPIDRLPNEAGSDYLAASPEENPKIGEGFAKASLIAARRLKKSKNPEDHRYAEMLESLGKKGVLRDLSEIHTVDDLARRFILANDYDAGHPLRTFLWQVHEKSGDKRFTADKLFLKSIYEFTRLPVVMSQRTQFILYGRKALQMGFSALVNLIAHTSIKIKNKVTKTEMPADELAWQANKATNRFLHRASNFNVFLRNVIQTLGMANRPALSADYLLPEYFRVMYRMTIKEDAELAKIVRKEAERAMNSRSIVHITQEGSHELVFVRTYLDKLKPIARLRSRQLVNRLEKRRLEIRALLDQAEQLQSSQPETAMAHAAQADKLVERYRWDLEAVQEFERTGSTLRLFLPHPIIGAITQTFKPIASYYLKRKEKAAQESNGEEAKEAYENLAYLCNQYLRASI